MTKETLTISLNGGEGRMTLNLINFFPCEVKEIRHFYKTCVLSDWCNDPYRISVDLLQHCRERMQYWGKEPKKLVRLMENDIKELERMVERYE